MPCFREVFSLQLTFCDIFVRAETVLTVELKETEHFIICKLKKEK